jgi:hypothetical protein
MTARPLFTIVRRGLASWPARATLGTGAIVALAVLSILPEPSPLHAERGRQPDPVTHWNGVAVAAFAPTEGTNPMAQSRTLAVLHAAIHDALNAIELRYAPYTPGLPPAPGASVEAAAAAASLEVLTTLVPDRASFVTSAYAAAVATLDDEAARAAGIATGRAAARATLARRRHDGAEQAAAPAYVPRSGPGEYQFTPPFEFAAQPRWGRVRPFVIELRDHGLEGPHPLASRAYARELDEVREIGSRRSTVRTAEQAEIARFWYEDSPLGWNRIASAVVQRQRLDPWAAARTLALVNFAMADGFIAGFDAKYTFRFWRPVTAILQADTDGNPQTSADPGWEPLLPTPPVPDYPSTHTVLGWAAAEVLIALHGDEVPFDATSLTLPHVTRRYDRISAAAEENGLSRLYAGIHFSHAVRDGRRQGRSIGRAVATALAPVGRHAHVTR